jgi:hypothetical protein
MPRRSRGGQRRNRCPEAVGASREEQQLGLDGVYADAQQGSVASGRRPRRAEDMTVGFRWSPRKEEPAAASQKQLFGAVDAEDVQWKLDADGVG